MLDTKADEVERLKAEGSIKDQELKKLQEAYLEEQKLHTEDMAKVDPTPGRWFPVPVSTDRTRRLHREQRSIDRVLVAFTTGMWAEYRTRQ